ncbi:unnamed protein product [Microthlaspi erraticum]|uniref:Uncharacterized protein n=1 Tax=Microthlaspi erraticum TaxID=1685480 RepID=A0A6D2HN65_9BRAS|nr:unnamed protein product [Microthlaspi erraticum]CAA7061189.1 unnamed protein product [Microthlaspi erraticum]
MSLNSARPVWKIEQMPTPRVMSDTVILPNGEIRSLSDLVNGMKKGSSGWGLGKDPNLSPTLYMPSKPLGQRFKLLAASTIPRVYHAIAIALPDGKVLIGGSNTNDGYKYNVEYPTELRIEKFSPPYLDPALANMRPKIVNTATPKQIRLLLLGIFEVKKEVGDFHQIQAVAPPSGNVAPPAYYLLFAVYNGVPSIGEWIQIV